MEKPLGKIVFTLGLYSLYILQARSYNRVMRLLPSPYLSVCPMYKRVFHWTDLCDNYTGALHDKLSRNSKFGKKCEKNITLYEDLSTFYCCRRHQIAIRALWNEMVSGCQYSRGGINITRTRHNVTLCLHGESDYPYCRPI